jgi:hypothetical protein
MIDNILESDDEEFEAMSLEAKTTAVIYLLKRFAIEQEVNNLFTESNCSKEK